MTTLLHDGCCVLMYKMNLSKMAPFTVSGLTKLCRTLCISWSRAFSKVSNPVDAVEENNYQNLNKDRMREYNGQVDR